MISAQSYFNANCDVLRNCAPVDHFPQFEELRGIAGNEIELLRKHWIRGYREDVRQMLSFCSCGDRESHWAWVKQALQHNYVTQLAKLDREVGVTQATTLFSSFGKDTLPLLHAEHPQVIPALLAADLDECAKKKLAARVKKEPEQCLPLLSLLDCERDLFDQILEEPRKPLWDIYEGAGKQELYYEQFSPWVSDRWVDPKLKEAPDFERYRKALWEQREWFTGHPIMVEAACRLGCQLVLACPSPAVCEFLLARPHLKASADTFLIPDEFFQDEDYGERLAQMESWDPWLLEWVIEKCHAQGFELLERGEFERLEALIELESLIGHEIPEGYIHYFDKKCIDIFLHDGELRSLVFTKDIYETPYTFDLMIKKARTNVETTKTLLRAAKGIPILRSLLLAKEHLIVHLPRLQPLVQEKTARALALILLHIDQISEEELQALVAGPKLCKHPYVIEQMRAGQFALPKEGTLELRFLKYRDKLTGTLRSKLDAYRGSKDMPQLLDQLKQKVPLNQAIQNIGAVLRISERPLPVISAQTRVEDQPHRAARWMMTNPAFKEELLQIENLGERELVVKALLSNPRQSSGCGSCFASALTIGFHSHEQGLLQSLKEYRSLLGRAKSMNHTLIKTREYLMATNGIRPESEHNLFLNNKKALLAVLTPRCKSFAHLIAIEKAFDEKTEMRFDPQFGEGKNCLILVDKKTQIPLVTEKAYLAHLAGIICELCPSLSDWVHDPKGLKKAMTYHGTTRRERGFEEFYLGQNRGGRPEAIMATYYHHPITPSNECSPTSPEEAFSHFFDYAVKYPDIEPHRKILIRVPKHTMNLYLEPLREEISRGKTCKTLLHELSIEAEAISSIMLTTAQQRAILEEFGDTSFMIDRQISVGEFGKNIIEKLVEKRESRQKVLKDSLHLQELCFKTISQRPKCLIVADTNWESHPYLGYRMDLFLGGVQAYRVSEDGLLLQVWPKRAHISKITFYHPDDLIV